MARTQHTPSSTSPLPLLGRLIVVALIASTATAQTVAPRTSLSLASFEVIASSAVPRACIQAWGQPFQSCTMNDFLTTTGCSSPCVDELEKLQRDVQASCQGIRVFLKTPLGQTLAGNLVGWMCAGGEQGGGDQDRPTTSAALQTTVRGRPTTSTTSAPVRTTSTSSPVTEETSTDAEQEPAQSTVFVFPPTVTSEAPTSTPTVQQEVLPGGSPFDLPPEQRAGAGTLRGSIPMWSAVWGLVVALLMVLFR